MSDHYSEIGQLDAEVGKASRRALLVGVVGGFLLETQLQPYRNYANEPASPENSPENKDAYTVGFEAGSQAATELTAMSFRQALALAADLNGASHHSSYRARILNGRIITDSKDGRIALNHPLVFGDPTDPALETKWLGTQREHNGLITFDLVRYADLDSGAEVLVPEQPYLDVHAYIAGTKGGPDTVIRRMWAADQQTNTPLQTLPAHIEYLG